MNFVSDAVAVYDDAQRIITFIQAARAAPYEWDLLRLRLRISVDTLENITENYNHSEADIQLQCEPQLTKVFSPEGTAPKFRARVRKIAEKIPEIGDSGLTNFFHKFKWPFDADTIKNDANDLQVWQADFEELRNAIANALAQDTNRQVKTLTQRLSEDELEELYISVSTVVPWQKVREDFKICSNSPPDWILREQKFHAFEGLDKSLVQELWGVGHFGVGKTIIASHVANYLVKKTESKRTRTSTAAVAVFYCNHKSMQEQSTDAIFKSLCRQVCEREDPSPHDIRLLQKFRRAQKSRSANDATPSWLLQEMARGYDELFVVIDALDECQSPLDLLTQLREIASTTSALRIFVTSRPDLWYFPAKIEDIQIRIVSKDEDMINFVHHGLAEFRKRQAGVRDSNNPLVNALSSPGKQDDVTKLIVSSAQGVFLIAELQLRSLQNCESEPEFESRLHGKNIDIGDLIKDYIDRIRTQPQQSKQTLGMRVLMWVLHAKRLLKVEELYQLLAMYDPDPSKRLVARHDNDPTHLSDYTRGLLNYDPADGTVSIHKGLQDTFELPRQTHTYFPGAEAEMARICLEYLSLVKFSYDQCKGERQLNDWIRANPFLGYAASHWGDHVRCSPETVFLAADKPLDLVAYLQNQTYLACYSNALYPTLKQMGSVLKPNDLENWTSPEEQEPLLPPLHVAVFFCLESLVEALVRSGTQVDSRSRSDFTPLHLACRQGSSSMVKLLVRLGADPGYRNRENQSCLHTAAAEGHQDIVEVLMRERPRMLNRLNWMPNTPLNDALRNRRREVSEYLISKGADLEIETGFHKNYSAIHWAAKYGVPSVIPTILERNKTRRLKRYSDSWYRIMVPALYLAIENHRNGAVGVLLNNDAPIAFTNHDPTYRTSLHVAAISGNAWAMEEILHRNPGAELPGYGLIIDLHSSRKETPLLLAIDNRHHETANVLVRHGAKAKPYPDGRTPLHLAAIHDVPEVIGPLLDRDPGLLNAVCGGHKTALLLAAQHGRPGVIDMLLKRGADPWIGSVGGGTPLHWATSNSRPVAVDVLAKHALANSIPKFLNVQNDKGKTALHEAAEFDRGNIARILLEAGAEMLVLSKGGGTPLHWAAERGNGIVDHLLFYASKRSVPLVNFLTERDRDALQVAVQHDHEETVRKLLAAGASPVLRGPKGATALHWAVSHNRFSIFKLLLANVLEKFPPTALDAQNEREMATLHEAAQFGHDDMIVALLDAGASLPANGRAGTPLHWATSHGHPSTIHLLIKYALKQGKAEYLDYANRDGKTALHEAAQYGRPGIAGALLEAGASPLVRAPIAGTPFHWAVSQNRGPIFDTLIAYASKLSAPGYLDYQNFKGKTALHEAAQFGREGFAQRLLDEGASPTLQDHEGRNALHWAAVSDSTVIMDKLVQKTDRVLLNQVTAFWQETPLHTAVVEKKHAALKKLLELGAHPEAVTVQRRTALHLAVSPTQDDAESAKILLGFHAKPEARNMMGATVLHEAVHGKLEIFDALLDKCDPLLILVTDDNGCTPLHLVACNGELEKAEKLVEKCSESKRGSLLRCRRKDGKMAADLALYKGARNVHDFLIEQEKKTLVEEEESAVPVQQQQPQQQKPVPTKKAEIPLPQAEKPEMVSQVETFEDCS